MRQERKIYKRHEKENEKVETINEQDSRSERRKWNKEQKALFKFYASVEEKYKSICPDLNLYNGPSLFDQFPKIRPDKCKSRKAKLTFAKLSTGFYSPEFGSEE